MSYVPASSTLSTSNLVSRNSSGNFFSNNITPGYTATVTAAGTTTLTVTSTQQQFFTGATTQTLVLPVVSTLSLGMQYKIVNLSSGAVTVQSSGGNTLQVMDSSSLLIATVISLSGTGTASWNWSYQNDSPVTLPLSLTNGGTNAALVASNGGIFYSTATAGAILSGTATANQVLLSGATAAPIWSTATYPATAGTIGNVLTSDGTNWTSAAAAGGASAGTLQYFATDGGASISGWLACDGSVVAQATYPDLFAQMGLINPAGTVWTTTDVDRLSNFNSTSVLLGTLSYLNSNYIGTLSNGPGYGLLTSTDALTWTARRNGTVTAIRSFTFGNSLYVGASQGGFSTSTDLTTWTYTTISGYGAGTAVNTVSFGNTFFAFAGIAPYLGSSTDGVTFTLSRSPLNGAQGITSIAYGSSKFVGIGTNRTAVTSTDGVTWNTTFPGIGQTSSQKGQPLAFGDKFVGVGASAFNPVLVSSTDFVNWTCRDSGTTTTQINGVFFGNSLYLYGGTGGILGTSTDGITWTSRTSGTSSSINAFTYGSLFVYGGVGGVLASSTDAITWDARTSGTSSNINALTFGSLYVLAGVGGALRSSTDAVTWDARTSGTTSQILDLTYASGLTLYAYCGAGGVLATSTDAVTWDARTSGTTSDLYSIIFQNSLFVCSGASSMIITSTDGTTWTIRDSTIGSHGNGAPIIQGLAYNSGIYYACAPGASNNAFGTLLLTSTDAITWSLNNSQNHVLYANVTASCVGLIFANSLFVCGDDQGQIGSSTDGITWSFNPSNLDISGTAQIAYGNSIWAVAYCTTTAANSNSIGYATSTDAITWVPTTISTKFQPFFLGLTYGTRFVGWALSGIGSAVVSNPMKIWMTNTAYTYDSVTQFQLPKDLNTNITLENINNFQRGLYIKT